MPSGTPWTSALVGEQLVTAFRRVPGCPVLSSARRFCVGGVEVEPFAWPERFIASRQDRILLMTWARCRATGERVAPLYRELLGDAERADYRRRVALATIARGLNAAQMCNASLTIPDATLELA